MPYNYIIVGKKFPHVVMPQDVIVLQLTNKEASTVLRSVVKDAGSGRARKKCRGKHETQSRVFFPLLDCSTASKYFTTEQSIVEASLFVL